MTDFNRFLIVEREAEKQTVIQSWSRLFDVLARIDERDRWLRQQRIDTERYRWQNQKDLEKQIGEILT